jgi:hypothetical protein
VTVRLIAVDPWDCRCLECTTGEYVALRFATDDDIADLLAGRLRNNLNSGTELEISVTHAVQSGKLTPVHVTVKYEHHDGQTREWTPDAYRAGMAK